MISNKPVASVIVCTRNRVHSLRSTLAALKQSAEATSLGCEVIVADNGSTDGTAALLVETGSWVISLSEPRAGKSRALNRALAVAQGDVLLFTDDDVRPSADWVDRMAGPILAGDADAVAGGVRLGAEVKQLWLSPVHESWMASTEFSGNPDWHPLIGANAAMARRVVMTVGGYDPEIGPGALGHAEDTLYSLQARRAGFKIITRFDVVIEHHPDVSRLNRAAYLTLARKRGDMEAYIEFHFEEFRRRFVALGYVKAVLRLWMLRLRRPVQWWTSRLPPLWELECVERCQHRRQLTRLAGRPANYEGNSFRKVRGEQPSYLPVAKPENRNGRAAVADQALAGA